MTYKVLFTQGGTVGVFTTSTPAQPTAGQNEVPPGTSPRPHRTHPGHQVIYLDARTARLHREVAEVQIDRHSAYRESLENDAPCLPASAHRYLYGDPDFIELVDNLI